MKSNTKTKLNRKEIEKIISYHFEGIEVIDVKELTEGWFNAIYVVKLSDVVLEKYDELVIKTGVTEDKYVLSYEKDLMKTEVKAYKLLQDTIIPIPVILKEDFSKSLVNCNYFIMEKLQGDNWGNLESVITNENRDSLIAEIAKYTAALHNIKGDYFGYVKEDKSYHFNNWKDAFIHMLNMVISDGKQKNINLPYDLVMEKIMEQIHLLDDVKEASLVNFDMWTKNIMLIYKDDKYVIDGIIDLERVFYGDPIADFISSNTICNDVSNNSIFKDNYSFISGKDFNFGKEDEIKLIIYTIYLFLIMGTEVYRYSGNKINQVLKESNENISYLLRLLSDISE